MNVDTRQVRQCLRSFDFKNLFIQELNWSHCGNRPIDLELDGNIARLSPLAELGGVVVYQVELLNSDEIPSPTLRRQIENKVKQLTHEHIIIFVDAGRTKAVWQWVRRSSGQQTATREHTYFKGQPGDSLLVKLDGIAFDISERDSDGNVKVIKVVERLVKAFDVEKVTKRFYDEFKTEHGTFCKFLKGLEEQEELDWYASVMLNRLMFIYFIQKKGFLNGDVNYLANKLRESQKYGANQFYRQFLITLFFEGFAKEEKERSLEVNQLLGKVPYLNGGLFLPHQLEVAHGENISISDGAFERLFAFFDRYSWHLDYRPLKADNEINPDVLGYIFEKYINQKQMGAYYTKEDITDYICKNTIVTRLFDKIENMHPKVTHPFPMTDIEPYIYEAVKQENHLPTETEREYQARQKRYQQMKEDFTAGKISSINDLITYNLDIRKFAEDWVAGIKDPVTLRAFYFHCLTKATILDPAVGSGAFLFAALNMLEPLYEICLDKMEELGGPKYPDFAEELKRISQHPNRTYFILKSIIVNNLFGVDIMEEAVEICKLRLFLKLVAQVDDVAKIEPLPDIDFNIRAGNTLVGYATFEEIDKAKATQLDLSGALKTIESRIQGVDRALTAFRDLQTRVGVPASALAEAKADVKKQLSVIQMELDRDLAAFYGARNLSQFVKTHQPFHWFVEFYHIMKDGGFDVIIGNPPYVEYRSVTDSYTVKGYKTEECGDLYAYVIERSLNLLTGTGRCGMIVPVSITGTDGFLPLRQLIRQECNLNWLGTYAMRPSKLFDGADKHLCILLAARSSSKGLARLYCTKYHRWLAEERDNLFSLLEYVQVPEELLYMKSIPKVGSPTEIGILRKLLLEKKTIGEQKYSGGEYVLYHTRKLRYFLQFLDRPPKIVEENGELRITSELKELRFTNEIDRDAVLAAYCSSLFFWYYLLFSDCRNVNKREVDAFPMNLTRMKIAVKKQLADISVQLMGDLQDNSKMRGMRYARYGMLEVQVFAPRLSKSVVDKIDRVLAQHYGFTEEEMDFVINYDIKYRMGKDNEEEDDS
jgi:hypothetical protein